MKRLMVMMSCVMIAVLLAVTASAVVSFTYDLEETEFDNVYKVVLTITEDEGDIRGFKNIVSFDNTTLIPADSYDGSTPDVAVNPDYPVVLGKYTTGSGRNEKTSSLELLANPKWTLDGANSKVELNIQNPGFVSNPYTPSNLVAYEIYFSLADGKTVAADSFKVEYINYSNGKDNYYGETTEGRVNNIVSVNNVIPKPVAPTVIKVPVQAGDIVYLQNGTSAVAAEAGEYTVLNDAGYVVVNTGKTAQSTYYVDGKTATLVHTNGAVGSDETSLRDRTPAADGYDKNGLRFKLAHNPTSRSAEGHEITELGFLMTAETTKVIENCGEDYVLDFAMTQKNIGTEAAPVYAAKKGATYKAADGVDIVYNKENDNHWTMAGVFYGIPLTSSGVNTVIVSRPYYVVDGEYVYGEITKASVYDVAKAIFESESYEYVGESMKSYVEEVLNAGKYFDGVVLDEIIIDLDGLYD